MTKKHRTFLQRYAERMGRERRRRRLHRWSLRVHGDRRESKFKHALRDYLASRPAPQQIRAAPKRSIMDRVKSFFRKPSV